MTIQIEMPCDRCGEPMPPLPTELTKMLAAGAPVELTHDVCPRDRAPEPDADLRYFEVRCSIVEVTEQQHPDGTERPRFDELASFVAGTRAANFDASLRPLAAALGEKWLNVEKHARIADPR